MAIPICIGVSMSQQQNALQVVTAQLTLTARPSKKYTLSTVQHTITSMRPDTLWQTVEILVWASLP